MRRGALGWRGPPKAIARLKQATSEILAAAMTDPIHAGTGVVVLEERVWPAFVQIDTSTGALDTAVNRTLDELIQVLIATPADQPTRACRVNRPIKEDGVDYLSPLDERFGVIAANLPQPLTTEALRHKVSKVAQGHGARLRRDVAIVAGYSELVKASLEGDDPLSDDKRGSRFSFLRAGPPSRAGNKPIVEPVDQPLNPSTAQARDADRDSLGLAVLSGLSLLGLGSSASAAPMAHEAAIEMKVDTKSFDPEQIDLTASDDAYRDSPGESGERAAERVLTIRVGDMVIQCSGADAERQAACLDAASSFLRATDASLSEAETREHGQTFIDVLGDKTAEQVAGLIGVVSTAFFTAFFTKRFAEKDGGKLTLSIKGAPGWSVSASSAEEAARLSSEVKAIVARSQQA